MTPPDITPYTGPILVTVLYVAWYYAVILYITRVRIRLSRAYAARDEKFDRYFGQDREMLAADRLQLNTLEHMGPFLALLWLNAVFVGTTSATIAGAVYLAGRVAYPFTIGARLGRIVPKRVFVATLPGYAVLFWFSVALVARLFR